VGEVVDGLWIAALSGVERLGKTCEQMQTLAAFPLISGPHNGVNAVDDNRFGVSYQVAISGVLCCGQLFTWLTPR
jgi:hypothetical protein